MNRFRMKGGIPSEDGKELSEALPIRDIWPARDLIYPVSETEEAPAGLLVKEGDLVLAGQMIATGEGAFPIPVYASVSGKVKAMEPRRTETGAEVYSVIVENDGAYREMEWSGGRPLEELADAEVLDRIRRAGIAQPGETERSIVEKLTVEEPDGITCVIGNCLECEPYLTADYRRLIEAPERIAGGLRAILRLFPNAEGILAVNRKRKDAVQALRETIEPEERMQVVPLKTKYPLGLEQMLTWRFTGRKLPFSASPKEAGCIVLSCDVLDSVYQAVFEGRPLLHRVVTVTGEAVAKPQNFRVCIGTSYGELTGQAGGFKREPMKLLSGGPMKGVVLEDLNVPVSRTASALLCMAKDEGASGEPGPCIRCGKCTEVCPENLLPGKLADFAQKQDMESFERYGGTECCGCGCCSYVCPAKRNLTGEIETARCQVKYAAAGDGRS